jgi:hypothetical protein
LLTTGGIGVVDFEEEDIIGGSLNGAFVEDRKEYYAHTDPAMAGKLWNHRYLWHKLTQINTDYFLTTKNTKYTKRNISPRRARRYTKAISGSVKNLSHIFS